MIVNYGYAHNQIIMKEHKSDTREFPNIWRDLEVWCKWILTLLTMLCMKNWARQRIRTFKCYHKLWVQVKMTGREYVQATDKISKFSQYVELNIIHHQHHNHHSLCAAYSMLASWVLLLNTSLLRTVSITEASNYLLSK